MLLNLDADILLFIQEHIRNKTLDPFFKTITHLGDAGIFWIILTVVLLCFKRTRIAGVYSAIALIGSMLVCNILLKPLVARTRPYEVINGLKVIVARATDYSFPSGHTSASFASSVAMCKKVKKPFAIVLLILAVLISISRLYVGIHYPSDVLAGFIIGVGLGILVNVIGGLFTGKSKKEQG